MGCQHSKQSLRKTNKSKYVYDSDELAVKYTLVQNTLNVRIGDMYISGEHLYRLLGHWKYEFGTRQYMKYKFIHIQTNQIYIQSAHNETIMSRYEYQTVKSFDRDTNYNLDYFRHNPIQDTTTIIGCFEPGDVIQHIYTKIVVIVLDKRENLTNLIAYNLRKYEHTTLDTDIDSYQDIDYDAIAPIGTVVTEHIQFFNNTNI